MAFLAGARTGHCGTRIVPRPDLRRLRRVPGAGLKDRGLRIVPQKLDFGGKGRLLKISKVEFEKKVDS